MALMTFVTFVWHALNEMIGNTSTGTLQFGHICDQTPRVGRRRHQSIDKTDDQVEGTTTSTSTSIRNFTNERGHETLTDELEGESGIVDPRPVSPITPDTPRAAAHNNLPTQDSAKQDDWQRHSRSIVTSSASAIGATTATATTTSETWEDIQAARKREEARRCIVEASRIRREQTDLAWVRRNWAIEQGDVAVVVDDGKEKGMLVGPNEEEDWEDAKPNSEQQANSDLHRDPAGLTPRASLSHHPSRKPKSDNNSTSSHSDISHTWEPAQRLELELEVTATEEDSDEREPLAVEKKTPSQGQGRKSHPHLQPLRPEA
ncbi:hypothetical protein F5888DRAFT_1860726 [Russula emetica]|nr:hypothetical protein F5888DRAFT_1860726 [Russula emetica]